MTQGNQLSDLQEKLGHYFHRPSLLLTALTHTTYANEQPLEKVPDNERLELLGDAVLDLVILHILMERFPNSTEGELSKLKSQLVNEHSLDLVARRLDLGDFLRLGRGEELNGGREKSSILSSAFEALVAALYLDSGMGICFNILESLFEERFTALDRGETDRDFKSRLQEIVQGRWKQSPRYHLMATRGPDHAKIFEMELSVGGKIFSRGTGRSKKEAEQKAAREALKILEEGL